MQNNNSNDYLHEDDISLKEIFKLLINSITNVIAITLVITTLGVIYSFQKAPEYKSTALIEIGHYDTFEKGENILIESMSELVQNLNIVFIHKSNNYKSLSIEPIENRLIKIEIYKPSIELGKKTLDEITRYIENRHSLLLSTSIQKSENQLSYEIETLNNKIKYSKSTLLSINEGKKLRIANKIEILNNSFPTIDNKIKILNKVILEDKANLKLLESNPDLFIQRASVSPTLNQVIYSYNQQLLDLKAEKITLSQEKGALKIQLLRLESNDLESDEIFKLSQEKDRLELKLAFQINQNATKTQLVGEILTTDTGMRKELIIILSFIFGLFLSIIMVLINNSLKALKED